MDLGLAMTKLEASLDRHLALTISPEVEDAVASLRAALEPAVRDMAISLAEQAALEVSSQLTGHTVDLVLEGGNPTLRVRIPEGEDLGSESMDARITLRLPPRIKEVVEQAADAKGESLNSFLVKFLSSTGQQKGRRFDGELRT